MARFAAIFPAAALMLLFSAAAGGAETKQELSYSYYLIDCEDFAAHRQSGDKNSYDNTADSFYVAGWISAYNRLKLGSGIPEDTRLDDILLWLDHYCAGEPDGNLADGLLRFGNEAKARRQKPPEPKEPDALAPPPPANGLRPLSF